MIVDEFKLQYTFGQEFILKPLFDAHLGNKYSDKRALKEYLADSDENTLIITGGDLIDAIITKDVKRYAKHSDDTTGDDIIDEQVEMAYDLLKPYEGRILGIGLGNHETTLLNHHGTHVSRRLAKMLNTQSLGYSWLLALKFSENGNRGRTLYIHGHHGWGGGSRTQGADLTKFSKDIGYWPANLCLYGHVHRRQTDRIDCFGVSGKRLIPKHKYICICGTFLKTYSLTDEPTYSEVKGYPPTSIGGLDIRIKPTRHWLEVDPGM